MSRRKLFCFGVIVLDSKGKNHLLIHRSGVGGMQKQNVLHEFESLVEIDIRALGLFQESDISHLRIVASGNEGFTGS